MNITIEEMQCILAGLSEGLSDSALTIEEIRLRLNLLHDIIAQPEKNTTLYANLNRHILGKNFIKKQDFDF